MRLATYRPIVDDVLNAGAGAHGLGIVICTGGADYPPNSQDWALAAALAADGHRVTLVLAVKRSSPEHTWQGCSVVEFPSGRPSTWRDARFFWHLLGRLRPQIVLASFFSVHLAMLVSALRGVPCRIAWYRVLRQQDRLDSKRSAWRQRAVEMGKTLSYRLATHAVAVSRAGQDDLFRHYAVPASKCRVFHTCRADPLDALGGSLPAKSATLRIACVARLVHSKGQDLLIRALKQLVDMEPTWSVGLELIGHGPLHDTYARMAVELGLGDRVHLSGRIAQAEVYRRMAAAHVVAIPFRSDPGPGVAVEALGLGVPIVMTSVGGLPELLEGSAAVVEVAPEDPIALAHALRTVLGDAERRAAMARTARELFLAKFHLDHWVGGVSGWLGELAAEAGQDRDLPSPAAPPA